MAGRPHTARAYGKGNMQKHFKKIGLYILLAAVIFLPGSIKCRRLLRIKWANQLNLERLVNENKHLIEENKRLKEDPVYIEKIVRENLGLAKKDEYVVKFIDSKTKKKR